MRAAAQFWWHESAACRESEDHVLPEGVNGRTQRVIANRALAVCASCPVLAECRKYTEEVATVGPHWSSVVVGGRYYASATTPIHARVLATVAQIPSPVR